MSPATEAGALPRHVIRRHGRCLGALMQAMISRRFGPPSSPHDRTSCAVPQCSDESAYLSVIHIPAADWLRSCPPRSTARARSVGSRESTLEVAVFGHLMPRRGQQERHTCHAGHELWPCSQCPARLEVREAQPPRDLVVEPPTHRRLFWRWVLEGRLRASKRVRLQGCKRHCLRRRFASLARPGRERRHGQLRVPLWAYCRRPPPCRSRLAAVPGPGRRLVRPCGS